MTRPNIFAALNLKNEERVIARCLRAVAPFVRGVVIDDSGSTDSTRLIVENVCSSLGLSLHWRDVEWVNYGHNRSELLSTARVASCGEGYTWLLDADECAAGELPICLEYPNEHSADAYHIARMLGDHEVWGIRIFSNRKAWRYEGAVHEIPAGPPGMTVGRLASLWVENRADGMQGPAVVDPEAVRARYARDAEHFAALLAANPNDTRAAYYLAQSLKDSGQHMAAFEAYQRRGQMADGFAEERYQSLLMVARYMRGWNPVRSVSEVSRAFLSAIECRPSRHEAMVELAGYLNDQSLRSFDSCPSDCPCDGCSYPAGVPSALSLSAMAWAHRAFHMAPGEDLFLVHRPSYQWLPAYELSRASEAVGWTDVAQSLAQFTLGKWHTIGETERATLERIARPPCPTPPASA